MHLCTLIVFTTSSVFTFFILLSVSMLWLYIKLESVMLKHYHGFFVLFFCFVCCIWIFRSPESLRCHFAMGWRPSSCDARLLLYYQAKIRQTKIEYNTAFLCHCWVLFILGWGRWYANMRPSDKKKEKLLLLDI